MSSSSSSSSENVPEDKTSRKRKAPEGDHGGKRHHHHNSKIELRKFAQECFQQFAQNSYQNYPPLHVPIIEQRNDDEISLNVSGELLSDDEHSLQLPLNFNTVLKEPTVAKSSNEHLLLLNNIQHLDRPEWCDVRYSEVQKNYCSYPGFIELDCNDEIKPFDKFSNLIIAERSYAALTQALIKQREATQAGFESLISWASKEEQLSASSLKDKINEVFIEGSYNKISSDLLQICCGHRADLIEQRRDSILRNVKDKFIRANLRKIPPTSDSLFNKESFSNTLEKSGGVSKVFWPIRNVPQKPNFTAAQAGPSHVKMPAQGYREPTQKYNNGRPFYNQPAQGNHSNYFQPGRVPVPLYYPPPQGFGFQYQTFPSKRFTQNQTRSNENASQRQRLYDDSRAKNMPRNTNNPQPQRSTNNFRSKRKF